MTSSIRPAWWARVEAAIPDCFTPDQWEHYLGGVKDEASADGKLRGRLLSGGMPDYCDGCPAAWAGAMMAAKKCFPPILSTLKGCFKSTT